MVFDESQHKIHDRFGSKSIEAKRGEKQGINAELDVCYKCNAFQMCWYVWLCVSMVMSCVCDCVCVFVYAIVRVSRDGPDPSSPQLGVFSGNTALESAYSLYHQVLIRFHSDFSTSGFFILNFHGQFLSDMSKIATRSPLFCCS